MNHVVPVDEAEASRSRWSCAGALLTRPFPLNARVIGPMIALMLLVPGYLVIGELTAHRTLHMPALALDRILPLQPVWSLVYASHLAFVFMPVLVVREEEQLRRTFLAYLLVWLTGYACFLAYPTVYPHANTDIAGGGFFAWMLQLIYSADTPRNNFPSLHVAHAFVSAFTCWRVSRGMGIAAGLWATLIALSTVFTKQHYVADVVTGVLLAGLAYLVFLRRCPRAAQSESDRRGAPLLVLGLIGIHGLVVAGLWVAYVIQHAN